MPELGVNDVPELELAAASNSLAIEYVGISPASGSDLTYQYRLGDDQEWSARSSAARRIFHAWARAGIASKSGP